MAKIDFFFFLHNFCFESYSPTPRHKDGFYYFYYLTYYPKRFKVSKIYEEIRSFIYDFKDGKENKEIAESISKDIESLNLCKPLSKWWLCIIPASSKNMTEIRFKKFCDFFCSETSINNGYSLLRNKIDRQQIHLQDERTSVNILDSIDIWDVKGKNILLFDDVYTTGRSFLTIARKLKSLGAIDVVGLFLGKTEWLEDSSD